MEMEHLIHRPEVVHTLVRWFEDEWAHHGPHGRGYANLRSWLCCSRAMMASILICAAAASLSVM